jgi:hypothetical protein
LLPSSAPLIASRISLWIASQIWQVALTAAEEAAVEALELEQDKQDAALTAFSSLPSLLQELIEVAMFISFAQGADAISTAEIQAAAIALSGPNKIEQFWRDAPGELREIKVVTEFEQLLLMTSDDA